MPVRGRSVAPNYRPSSRRRRRRGRMPAGAGRVAAGRGRRGRPLAEGSPPAGESVEHILDPAPDRTV